MADLGLPSTHRAQRRTGWINRLVASRSFQRWAARFPLTRPIVRHEGEVMFDLVAGFCHSQILQALVAFNIPNHLMSQEVTANALAHRNAVPLERMVILLNGGVSIGLLSRRRDGTYGLTRRGAALTAVPGLADMIKHHEVLYRDLADPVAFFRGETQTELAGFWPYVFGAGAASDPETAATYSQLMADSQVLVAEDTLAAVSFKGIRRLMDVGGGTGAFLAAVAAAEPDVSLTLFDLPAVAPGARVRFEELGFSDRLTIEPGSFRDDPLPRGADAISLIRVLYDHSDDTVRALLLAVHAALPPGGRLIISEPMTGGDQPQRAGDAYFALYCLAMRTGRARSASEIATLLAGAGFGQISTPRPARPFITSTLTSVRLG
ncbi:MAG: methyltransferase [Rhodobacterales bacterium]|nr:methyltransferase [Rhodobacterales bacterium]